MTRKIVLLALCSLCFLFAPQSFARSLDSARQCDSVAERILPKVADYARSGTPLFTQTWLNCLHIETSVVTLAATAKYYVSLAALASSKKVTSVLNERRYSALASEYAKIGLTRTHWIKDLENRKFYQQLLTLASQQAKKGMENADRNQRIVMTSHSVRSEDKQELKRIRAKYVEICQRLSTITHGADLARDMIDVEMQDVVEKCAGEGVFLFRGLLEAIGDACQDLYASIRSSHANSGGKSVNPDHSLLERWPQCLPEQRITSGGVDYSPLDITIVISMFPQYAYFVFSDDSGAEYISTHVDGILIVEPIDRKSLLPISRSNRSNDERVRLMIEKDRGFALGTPRHGNPIWHGHPANFLSGKKWPQFDVSARSVLPR